MYNKPIGTSRDVPVDIETLNLEDFLVKDLRSLVRISRTREGLLLQVEGEAHIEVMCGLCLVEFYLPVKFEFEELYQFPSRHREVTDLILPFDGYIDLRSLYREFLILAMPIKPICQPDCKGLCAVCGTNLNVTTCEHHPELETLKGMTKGAETA